MIQQKFYANFYLDQIFFEHRKSQQLAMTELAHVFWQQIRLAELWVKSITDGEMQQVMEKWWTKTYLHRSKTGKLKWEKTSDFGNLLVIVELLEAAATTIWEGLDSFGHLLCRITAFICWKIFLFDYQSKLQNMSKRTSAPTDLDIKISQHWLNV